MAATSRYSVIATVRPALSRRSSALFALPLGLRNGVATVVSGSLVAPFIVLVVTDVYYRLVASTPPVRV